MSASWNASSMSSTTVSDPPPASAASRAFSIVSGMRSQPGGWARTTSTPNLGINMARPCGTESGLAYDGA
jgi:hypothetical protein